MSPHPAGVVITPGLVLLAAGCLAVGGWLWWHREAPKITTVLYLGAGAAIGGLLVQALASPLTTLGIAAAGMFLLAVGSWRWWLHGGYLTESSLTASLVGVGASVVSLVAARLCEQLAPSPWGSLPRLALAAAVVILAAEVVIKGMWKGRARPRRYHPWLALALPTLALAVGVPVLSPALSGLSTGLATVGAELTTTHIPAHTPTHTR